MSKEQMFTRATYTEKRMSFAFNGESYEADISIKAHCFDEDKSLKYLDCLEVSNLVRMGDNLERIEVQNRYATDEDFRRGIELAVLETKGNPYRWKYEETDKD